MSIAVHVDSRRMASVRRHRGQLVGRRCAATYIAIPQGESGKKLLERARIPYATCEGSTIVYGRNAEELGPLLNVPRFPALPGGRLPADDPLGRQLAAAVFESLLPEPSRIDETCAIVFSPGLPSPVESSQEWQFFSRLTRLHGYRAESVPACEAAALCGLEHVGFCGLALVIDSTASGLAYVHRGEVQIRAEVPIGADWIDEHLARKTERIICDTDGTTYIDVEAVGHWKVRQAPNLHAPQNDEVQLLVYIYQQLLEDLLGAFVRAYGSAGGLPVTHRPLAMVCCGEATSLTGFPHLLAEQLAAARFPIEVSELRSPDDGEFALPRGGLIRAELDSLSARYGRSA